MTMPPMLSLLDPTPGHSWAVCCADGERHAVPFGRREVADEFAARIDIEPLPQHYRDCRPHAVVRVEKINGEWLRA